MKTNALMYRPSSQGTIWAGLVCAAAIFAVAICLGRTRIEPSMPVGVFDDTTAIVDLVDPDPEPVAAPDEAQTEPPQPETPQDAFPAEEIEQRKMVNKPRRPVTRPAHHPSSPGAGSISARESTALYAPRPDYPYEARRQNATGSGLVSLRIDPASGLVTNVRMVRSTGRAILDMSAIKAFQRWRFKPGAGPILDIPITFTLTGASY